MDLFLCLSLFGLRYQKYHSLVAYKQQTFILNVLESGKSKIMAPPNQHLMRAQFFLINDHLFTVTLPGRMGEKAFGA